MEESTNIDTAQDLFEFLKDIPEGHRKVLPVTFMEGYSCRGFSISYVEAYRTFDDEGNEKRSFMFVGDED